MTRAASIGLSEQLAWTAQCLARVDAGQSLTEALAGVPAPARPGVQALSFHALRHWGLARAVVRQLAPKSPAPLIRALLGSAITLLPGAANASGQPSGPQYAPHTVVNEAVTAARTMIKTRSAAGFVNACLRRVLREDGAWWSAFTSDPVVMHNHPAWWIDRVRRDHPAHWPTVLKANRQQAPLVLRVNARQQSRSAYRETLAAQGLRSAEIGDDGLVLQTAVPVTQLPGWHEGRVSVQDGAAQLAAPLLQQAGALKPGARVLDACAAPGGKTAHLLERADLNLLALDRDPVRARRIEDTLSRLGLRATVRVADAGDPPSWWDGQPFEAVLLDAPCSASGIVRRHPDVPWLRRPTDLPQLAQQQDRLLRALWPTVAPGGHLLYATCSVFREEGEDRVEAFLRAHADAERRPAPGHLLPGVDGLCADMPDNPACGFDGFFYALLRKRSP